MEILLYTIGVSAILIGGAFLIVHLQHKEGM